MNGLALALWLAGFLAYFERNTAEADRLASDLIELSTRQNFAIWLAAGDVLRGWARSACGYTAEGISWIEDGAEDWRASGSTMLVPYWLALKAEALHLADRTSEALVAIREAEMLVERFEERWWYAELQRLRGVFLATRVLRRPKSRLHCRKPSESLRSRSRFRSHGLQLPALRLGSDAHADA